jgi:hypothetical protein
LGHCFLSRSASLGRRSRAINVNANDLFTFPLFAFGPDGDRAGFYDDETLSAMESAFRNVWKAMAMSDPFHDITYDDELRT